MQNKLIRQAASLKQRKYRDELGLFAVEGVRLCEAFAASDWQSETCLFTAEAAASSRVADLLAVLAAKNCRMALVSESMFTKISDTEQPQGVMVLAVKKPCGLADMLTAGQPLIVIADGLQDPGNVGTLIRNAEATGCSGVILTQGSVDLYAGKTVRATMGSLFCLPVMAGVSRAELLTALEASQVKLTATTLEAASVYYQADLTGPLAIAFGNEGRGLSNELLTAASSRIFIPMYGRGESLNVAAASAVILYEAARQRAR